MQIRVPTEKNGKGLGGVFNTPKKIIVGRASSQKDTSSTVGLKLDL